MDHKERLKRAVEYAKKEVVLAKSIWQKRRI